MKQLLSWIKLTPKLQWSKHSIKISPHCFKSLRAYFYGVGGKLTMFSLAKQLAFIKPRL